MKDLFLRESRLFVRSVSVICAMFSMTTLSCFCWFSSVFLAYQYSQLLQHFPENHWPIFLFVGITSILLAIVRCIFLQGQAIDIDGATIRCQQTDNFINSRRFPSTIETNQTDQLPTFNSKGYIFQDRYMDIATCQVLISNIFSPNLV